MARIIVELRSQFIQKNGACRFVFIALYLFFQRNFIYLFYVIYNGNVKWLYNVQIQNITFACYLSFKCFSYKLPMSYFLKVDFNIINYCFFGVRNEGRNYGLSTDLHCFGRYLYQRHQITLILFTPSIDIPWTTLPFFSRIGSHPLNNKPGLSE